MEQTTADKVSTKSRGAKLLRVLTVPPVMALMLVSILYIGMGAEAFATPVHYFEAVFSLALLPVLAYPLCAIIPSWRKKGRKLERSVAIVLSLLGYIMGTLFAFLAGGTKLELTLYLTYIISGAMLGVLTFAFKFKASGHTCGAAGPAAMLTYVFGPWWLLSFLALVPVFASSLRLKRHTWAQLLAGGTVSVAALVVAILIVGRI